MTEKELRTFLGKTVKIIKNDNKVVKGFASSFIPSVDNEPEVASLLIELEFFEHLEEVYLDEIKSIEVIDK